MERASLNDIAEVEEIVKSVKKEKIVEERKKEKDKARKDAKEKANEAKMNEKMAKWYNERKDFVGMPKPSPKKVGQAVYEKWRRWHDAPWACYAGDRYDVEKAKAAWEASKYAKGDDAAA